MKQFQQCRFNLIAIKIVKNFLEDAPQDPARLAFQLKENKYPINRYYRLVMSHRERGDTAHSAVEPGVLS